MTSASDQDAIIPLYLYTANSCCYINVLKSYLGPLKMTIYEKKDEKNVGPSKL